MAGIGNIIGAYNINPKRVSSKLTFEVGQIFSAKIVSPNELNKELILKLLDGWQFPAKLEKPLDFAPEGLVNFQVEGFKDGKLQIKIVNNNQEKEIEQKGSLKALLDEINIDADKEDLNIFEKMIKHNMPITKENISKIKTILDFKERIAENPQKEDSFIKKYIQSKGIDDNSAKAGKMEKLLKGFLGGLKNISEDEIFTMLENDIDLTEDNIKSFLKIFNGEDSYIYKKLNSLKDIFTKQLSENKTSNENNNLIEVIESRIHEMKSIIKNLIEKDNSEEGYNKIIQELKENINDFKVYNSVSNQYYYLDIPLDTYKSQYSCKLLIKDDRKSGKKIDSKNVSLVVSVKADTIGTVDAYIKVKEENMNVEIKCHKQWIKILSEGKNKLLNELSESYNNVFININERKAEANLVNCSDFFEDNNLGSINIRV